MNEGTSATLLHLAVYLANLFFLTSDTIATVIEDATLTVETAALHNLIIIGGPGDNSWAQRFLDRIPLGISENGKWFYNLLLVVFTLYHSLDYTAHLFLLKVLMA